MNSKTSLKLLALASAALFATSSALATGTPAPKPPTPTPTTPAPVTPTPSTSTATAGAGADASATVGNVGGGSVANTTATGGHGGQGGQGGSSNATGGQGGNGQGGSSTSGSSSASTSGDSSAAAIAGPSYSAAGDVSSITNSSSKYLSLPQPVWTAVPTAFGCLVTEAKAGAIGWNFLSASGTRQTSDVVCTTIRMAEAAALHCHFASAAQLNKRAFEHMHPGASGEFFLLGNPQNLGPVECEDLKRPKLRIEPALQQQPAAAATTSTTTVNVAAASCPAPAPAARPAHKPLVRKAAKKPCVTCCKA
jgi:hypothetical protein